MMFKPILVCCILLFVITIVKPLNADQQYHHEEQIIHSRHKRSSGDILGKIKHTITSSIGKASASSAGASSGTSSSKVLSHEKPVEKEIYFDGWELKKSILNTLFQAVKAITGGVTAIKGQLIKGSGYALSHGGKLVAASGDAVTNVGKKIALSAKLLPPEKPHYHKYFGSSSSHLSGHTDDFTSYHHDDLVEFAQPHEIPVYAPEPHIPYLPPLDVTLESHYPATHYGPPLLDNSHSHSHYNYISTDRKEQNPRTNDKPLSLTTGLDSEQTLSTQDANQKAIEALSYVLRNLPNRMKDETIGLPPTIDTDNIIFDKRPMFLSAPQFRIPNDPSMAIRIPEFKPLNSITSTYKMSLGPIESVTRHTIAGPVINDGNDDTIGTILATAYSNKQVVVDKPQITIKSKLHHPLPPQIQATRNHSHTINAQPLDLYHTMSLKNDPVKVNIIPLPHQHKHRLVSHLHSLPPYKPKSPQFEIQKSIEYQLH